MLLPAQKETGGLKLNTGLGFTIIVSVPTQPVEEVKVIIEVPGAIAVTNPVELIEATKLFEDDHTPVNGA